MSGVPKSKRGTASSEYVATAQKIYHLTLTAALRLPKRWMFLVSERMADHAERMLYHAKAANSIFVSCSLDAQLRRAHLTQALCHAQALSSMVDEVQREEPQRTVGSSGRVKPCLGEGYFEEWGNLLFREFGLIRGVMRSDMDRHAKYLKGEDGAPPEPVQLQLF